MLTQAAIISERRITADEFEIFVDLPENRERLLELINGAIVEKTPTQEHGFIAATSLLPSIFLQNHYVWEEQQ